MGKFDLPMICDLISACLSVLLVYSHDCALHEAAIHAFAEVLRDTFGLQVHIDQWDQEAIEENFNTYINSSVVRADKVIIVNSIGAYMRAKARHKKLEPLERIPQGPLDRIFDLQIDLALQHARVISVRFPYTNSSYTLYALTPLLQYTIPDNLGLLVSTLTECTLRSDPRLSGFDPHLSKLNAAVSRMSHFQDSDPTWFEKSHHRIQSLPLGITESRVMDGDHSIDSGLGDSTQIERRTKERINGIILKGELDQAEEMALLEEEKGAHEVIPEEPSASSSPRHVAEDSAYLSGRFDSIVPTACTSDADNRSSGSDRPDDPVISLESNPSSLPKIHEPQRIEEKRKAFGKNSIEDSGILTSEYPSGAIVQ